MNIEGGRSLQQQRDTTVRIKKMRNMSYEMGKHTASLDTFNRSGSLYF